MNKPWNTKMKIDCDEKYIKQFILWYNEIQKNKNGKKNGKLKITNNLNSECLEYIRGLYDSGYGLKIIARTLNITYSQIRTIFALLGIKIRKGKNVVTSKVKEFRSFRVKGNKNPWSDWECRKNTFSKGIQGYFIDRKNRKIWLRSTWEYIYAKWLDKNYIDWDFEGKQYKLNNGESYRPDFTINDKGKIRIVEIKGYYKDRLYKVNLFRNEYNIDITVIDDISNYCNNYEKELSEWKLVRKLKK